MTVKTILDGRIMFRLVQAGVILSLLIGLGVSVKVYSLTSCLSTYNDRQSKSSLARSDAFERATDAEDKLWLAVNDAQSLPPDEARRKSADAFQEYIAERQSARQERASHPLPAPPSETCR